MKEIQIPAHEHGVSRLFALSMTGQEAQTVRAQEDQQAALLGVDTLRTAGVEVFRVSDLGDMGLLGYLREGVDAQEADLKRDAQKLMGLDGWVMLVHSSAFDGRAVHLRPDPALTLIGTYGQVAQDKTPAPLEAETAQPYTGVPLASTPASTSDKRSRTPMAVIAAIVLLVLLLVWAFV